ncbi:histidine decarboxylase [Nocardia sp. NPDC004068]|uniref:histidine decarboxylase n=1 Tax=Nocardia sp. NPDC004068 TaxID=3364303 RepID=UPI0036C013C3
MELPDEEELVIGDDPATTASGSPRDVALLQDIAARMLLERDHMLGFPVNLDFDYRDFALFLGIHANNAGSPYDEGLYHLHTKPFERAVVTFFARLAGLPEAFGYLTSGGTESNLFGCLVAREHFPDAVLYHSESAHSSIRKIGRILRMDACPVPVRADGVMDPDRLAETYRRRGPERAALVVATVGTTTGGAYDDLVALRHALAEAGADRVHVHSDAAFGGLLAALAPTPRPWAFESGADSVAISGHKMIGGPIPCGIVLARDEDAARLRSGGAEVGTDDDTVTGSRNALSTVLLWYELRRLGVSGLRRRVRRCLAVADYAERRLREEGMRPERPAGGNTVLFDAPEKDVCRRWNLIPLDDRVHLITMPHVTGEHIDRLCADLRT